jgi:RimJ/RimL family protein N-acetyltransferase
MSDARHYTATEALRNGQEICIRAGRPDDTDRIIEAFHKLDPESIYLRFFGPKKELSEADIRRFREIDFDSRVVLLATVTKDGDETVIASGTYARESATRAEIAFIVEEDYHRLGISGRLIKHLATIATAAGITTFTAEVLPQNNAMLGVFSRCGYPMKSHTADGTVHISLDLARPCPARIIA